MREMHDMSGPDGVSAALFGFVPPGSVGALTVSESAIHNQLRSLLGDEAPAPTRILVQDWRNEALTSPPGVEGLQGYETFGHPLYATPFLGGRAHWASTETAAAFPGHIEGALVAATRAADAVQFSASASEAS
jgi:monoamine oxidase